MTEWTVVFVIVTLVGLVGAVLKPILSLNTNITQLTTVVNALQKNIDCLTSKNTENHARIWEHNELQDKMLSDHETRITVIEKSKGAD
jgi:hypothetical protein